MSFRIDVQRLAQEMTENRYAKLDLEDDKSKARKQELDDQATTLGFKSTKD